MKRCVADPDERIIIIDGGTYIHSDGTVQRFPQEKTHMACKGSKRSGKRGK